MDNGKIGINHGNTQSMTTHEDGKMRRPSASMLTADSGPLQGVNLLGRLGPERPQIQVPECDSTPFFSLFLLTLMLSTPPNCSDISD